MIRIIIDKENTILLLFSLWLAYWAPEGYCRTALTAADISLSVYHPLAHIRTPCSTIAVQSVAVLFSNPMSFSEYPFLPLYDASVR